MMYKQYRFKVSLFLLISGFVIFFNMVQAAPKIQLEISPSTLTSWQQSLTIKLKVPESHHAYLDKGTENAYIPLAIDPKQKITELNLLLNVIKQPLGIWDEMVQATILRGQGQYVVSIDKASEPFKQKELSLEVRYQLCNDITNVCYRPQLAKTNLNIAVDESFETAGSWTEQISALFERNKHNTLLIFALMLLAGLLSVATPCVYPMLPITSVFIANRGGSSAGAKRHAFVYMLGIVSTYMILGLLAGLSGGAFNSVMQSAFVNLAFAAFFSFFGIALLGVFEFSFMQNNVHQLDQKTAEVKGIFGTWLMGSVAGLVISPCVGPIVFAVLLQVSDNIAQLSLGLQASGQLVSFFDKLRLASQGSLMMAGFGLGVGFPFFLTGLIKFKLPKAGHWMNKVKYGFGLIIIYFAYTYFAKGMGILEVPENATLGLVAGMVALWLAIIHCNILAPLSEGASLNHRFHRFCGVISALVGAWLILVNLQQTPFIMVASANATESVQPAIQSKQKNAIEIKAGIHWYRDYQAAQIAAKESGKPIFIDFYASWCANCIEFSKQTETDVKLNQVLREEVIALKLVDKELEFERFRNDPNYRALKIGLPFFAVLSPDGKKLWSGTDYQATASMIKAIRCCVGKG